MALSNALRDLSPASNKSRMRLSPSSMMKSPNPQGTDVFFKGNLTKSKKLETQNFSSKAMKFAFHPAQVNSNEDLRLLNQDIFKKINLQNKSSINIQQDF
eukprot:CAMPEP_0202970226 /NCGR_PEP_ID=MMETSP1396-20130829/16219_1 /ASSEMBLY_ACC=CAM_ASM_000872 /TAXON_ID= /ORGANISM="Pseudokeronopsis sp., Strain Brazil" /LENGTH=99 /DNA_ID=CAMNT_0049698607 /DNA_START=541 /DNA_END=840 /DNA_ORIENTATION=+